MLFDFSVKKKKKAWNMSWHALPLIGSPWQHSESGRVFVPRKAELISSRVERHISAKTSAGMWIFCRLLNFVPHTTCHVIVHSRLSLSMGGVAAGASPSLASGRGQGAPWTSRSSSQGLTYGVQYLAQGHFNMQLSPELGFEPATFQSLVDLLYPLSYSRPATYNI